MLKKTTLTYFLIGCVMVCGYNARSQQSYTLEQAVSYAMENAPGIKKAQLDYEIAQDQVRETTTIGLPQINGKWDFMYNLEIQKQFIPAQVFEPNAPADLVVPVGFGLDYSSNASATLTQLLFDGSYIIGLKAAKTYTELAQNGITKSKEDVVVNVRKSYYMVLITQNRMLQLEENQKLLDQLLKDTEAMVASGFVENVDYKRVKVNINNLTAELHKLRSFEEISMNMLKFQMGMPLSDQITLTDHLDSRISDIKAGSSTVNYDSRSDYQMLTVQDELNELNMKNEKIRLLPSLAAFGTLGVNYATNDVGDAFNFGDYQDFSMIGVSLNVPIWSSGQRKYRIAQSKSQMEKTSVDIELLQRSIEMESMQAVNNLNNSIEVLEVRKENVTLAEEVFDHAKIKYEQGVGSSFEVTSAQTDLKTAQTEYYNALYDAIISKIDLDKANGQLNVE